MARRKCALPKKGEVRVDESGALCYVLALDKKVCFIKRQTLARPQQKLIEIVKRWKIINEK